MKSSDIGIIALIAITAVPAFVPVSVYAQSAVSSVAVAAASASVDFSPLLDASVKIIADLVIGIGGIVGLWLAFEIKKKWGIDVTSQVTNIEKNYRETLQSAVLTWTSGAVKKFGADAKFNVGSKELAYILNGIITSSPDAVENLGLTEEWLENAVAKALNVVAPVLPVAAVPVPVPVPVATPSNSP